jgi:hypothetical protein
MKDGSSVPYRRNIVPFNRSFFNSGERISSIGSGSIGGKAQGLVALNEFLQSDFDPSEYSQIKVGIPTLAVIGTDIFDAFMERNDLFGVAQSDASDEDIAHVFQRAELPFEILGDLNALANQVRSPLAIRSSSLLEDAANEPFAGIYGTKMIPNHQPETSTRFQRLVEAIKFVYASTFSRSAKNYRKATGHSIFDEKMAVIIQEVIGRRHDLRFYPDLSGVARSYNFYPFGRAKPEDGVVNLALGLGKTIVDGGTPWTYSPTYPRIGPPYGSVRELLQNSQKDFWAINMGPPPPYDPLKETEYLLHEGLPAAEMDGTLAALCSTYDVQSDRLIPGTNIRGPRVLNFAPLLSLKTIPINDLIKRIMSLCKTRMGVSVEIEFAMTFDPASLGLLQVRPMVIADAEVEINEHELLAENVLVASEQVLGNGIIETIQDVVYVIPDQFEKENTRYMAEELSDLNRSLLEAEVPYLLIVFGRLGSSDPWLGIPVDWGGISGAKAIVEASMEDMRVEMSQGSHFFHNLTGLGIGYFSVPYNGKFTVDWAWLQDQEKVYTGQFVRHVRLKSPLKIKMDGRLGRGVICRERGSDNERFRGFG